MIDWETLAPLLLLGVVFVSLVLYMVLDGFDLGVGTIALAERDDGHSHEMVESIATVWDGNESWLVLVGSALFAGFPLAYGTVLPALYIPLTVMLLALIFRGVSFEFQAQHEGYDRRWGLAFSAGSVVAAFSQGLALGGFLQGIPVTDDRFTGSAFDFLSPFSVLVGVLVTALYSLSGAGWLVYRTRGDLLRTSREKGRALAIICAALIPLTLAAATIWSPVADNALSGGRLPLVAITVVVAFAGLLGAYVTLGWRDDAVPLVCASVALASLVAGGAAAAYPYLVPPGITFADAAAPTSSSLLMLAVVGPLIPVTVAYNAYSYWAFRGRSGAREHS